MYSVTRYGTVSTGTKDPVYVSSVSVDGLVTNVLFNGDVTTTSILTKSYYKAVLYRNPVGYWRLDDKSGGILNAEVGSNGSYFGNPVLGVPGAIEDLPNAAVEFRYADYARVSNFEQPNITQLTFAAWIMQLRDDAFEDIFVISDVSSGGIVHGFRPRDGQFRFVVHDGNFRTVSVTPSTEEWIHYVGTFDNGQMRLYKNGELVNEDQVGSTLTELSGLGIGARSNGDSGAEVRVDEAAVFDYALSSKEVELLYKQYANDPKYIEVSSAGITDYSKSIYSGGSLLFSSEGVIDTEIDFYSGDLVTNLLYSGILKPEVEFSASDSLFFESGGVIEPDHIFNRGGFVTNITSDGQIVGIGEFDSSGIIRFYANGRLVPEIKFDSGSIVSYGSTNGSLYYEKHLHSNGVIPFGSDGYFQPELDFSSGYITTIITSSGSRVKYIELHSSDYIELGASGLLIPIIPLYSGGFVYTVDKGGAAWWYLRDIQVEIFGPSLRDVLVVNDPVHNNTFVHSPAWINRKRIRDVTLNELIHFGEVQQIDRFIAENIMLRGVSVGLPQQLNGYIVSDVTNKSGILVQNPLRKINIDVASAIRWHRFLLQAHPTIKLVIVDPVVDREKVGV